MPSLDQILAERRRAARRGTDSPRLTPQAPPPAAPPPPPPTATAGPTPFSQTRAGVIFAGEQQRQALTIQRENQAALARRQQQDALIRQQREQMFQRQQLQRRLAEEQRIRAEARERERQANINQLRAERQGTFAQMVASGDSARAAIFALGFGPENDAFDARARQLGTTVQEIKGGRRFRVVTENALSRALNRFRTSGGRTVTVGREGVRGLGTAVSAARSFVQGGADVQQLLTSAFGVGSLRAGEQPGLSQARLTELVRSVTPTGVL